MQFWTPEQAISLSLHIDPDQPVPKHLRTSFAERLRELQGTIEERNPHLTVRLGKVERSTFVFWASQCEDHEDWKIPRESPLYKIAVDEPIPEQGTQNAAEIHENRYRAVGEYAQSASFDVAELDAWAVANRVPGSFSTLLTPDSVGADLPSARRFQPCSSLLVLIASAFVPADMEPHEAQAQLLAAGDTGEYPNAVNRLRDLIMGRYERMLLSAVFDGELDLYDTLTGTKIDVHAARLGYKANPDAYLQAADERVMAAHVYRMAELVNNNEEFIDWDYWAGKMPRWTADQAVRLMAALDPAKHTDLSFKRNETAGAAKEQAKRLETLAASHEITDESPSNWLKWADSLREPVHEGCRNAVFTSAIPVAWVAGLPAETPEQRQRRRLARFRELGGDIRKAGGGQWQLTGTRGVLAALAREEKSAGRARHDASDIRKELERAAAAENREQIGS